MNRLIAIGLSLLMLVGFSANAVAMSDGDEETYLGWVLHKINSSALVVAELVYRRMRHINSVQIYVFPVHCMDRLHIQGTWT